MTLVFSSCFLGTRMHVSQSFHYVRIPTPMVRPSTLPARSMKNLARAKPRLWATPDRIRSVDDAVRQWTTLHLTAKTEVRNTHACLSDLGVNCQHQTVNRPQFINPFDRTRQVASNTRSSISVSKNSVQSQFLTVRFLYTSLIIFSFDHWCFLSANTRISSHTPSHSTTL